jgi:hypothetical protein
LNWKRPVFIWGLIGALVPIFWGILGFILFNMKQSMWSDLFWSAVYLTCPPWLLPENAYSEWITPLLNGALYGGAALLVVLIRRRAVGIWMALFVGVLLTAFLAGAAYIADMFHATTLSLYLFWPNSLLQGLAPCIPLNNGKVNLCEGSPINLIMFFLSFPVSIFLYATAAFLLIRAFGRSRRRV